MTSRRPARFPYLEHDGVLAFAHRGGAGDWPENTMPAFQAAVDLGYRYIETDVHATRDGVLLAFHDDELDRVTDSVGVIAEMDYADVARARVGGREPIPRAGGAAASLARHSPQHRPEARQCSGAARSCAESRRCDRPCVCYLFFRRAHPRRQGGSGAPTLYGSCEHGNPAFAALKLERRGGRSLGALRRGLRPDPRQQSRHPPSRTGR